ncbi:CehA/McbA family metallohydrolase [Bacillus sp. GX]|uniref:CehA/McbA family metallohydrolase n=1 Tax=Bacillus TaxID=1386 RepID=UPI000B4A8584|nr:MULTISPECIES: CehA/McbA family metallohydrolase [Bacillus]MBU5217611.1 CehA/McbA family metallohydrolase [Bacillus albus]MDC6157118.1 CehA/McbA family metallohydrolase [Bacillus albus]MDD8006595.1 CehA/McbA family metallohydrolase [Bacillus albus]UPL42033.1 CehA/McbA family metallohydrolase [Bacillus sp. PGP15]WPU72734.1 CehA/McbA family metallohydrolase [Bacillus sp. RA(2023)]
MIEITSTITLSPFVKNKHCFKMDETDMTNFTLTIDQGDSWKIPLLLILRDPNGYVRIQYQTPIVNEKLVVSKDLKFCSAGCIGGDIQSGNWELEVVYIPHCAKKVVKFTGGKVDYTVNIEVNDQLEREYNREHFCTGNVFIDEVRFNKVVNEEHRWYKGDFHEHTDLTDGEIDDELGMKVCEKQELDFLYATEHNIIIPSYEKGNTLIIPSMELTTPYGHYNIFGIREFVDFTEYVDESFSAENINTLFSLMKEKGYVVSVNHPFMKPWANQININLENVQTMEIMCDPTYKKSKSSTLEALRCFDQMWSNGLKIWGIGGSDSHLHPSKTFPGSKDPSIYGDPGTYVLCKGLSINNLKSAIENGKIYFSRFRKLVINIQNEDETIYVGDEAKGNIVYNVQTDKPCEWRLLINGEIMGKEYGSDVTFTFALHEGAYARVEGWEEDELVAFINPIHNKVKYKNIKTWNEVIGGIQGE